MAEWQKFVTISRKDFDDGMAKKADVTKVGTAPLTTDAPDLSGAVNELKNASTNLDNESMGLQNGTRNYEVGKRINQDGTIKDSDTMCLSANIPIIGGHTIGIYTGDSISENIFVCEFDSTGTYKDYWSGRKYRNFISGSSTSYLRVSFLQGFHAKVVDETTGEQLWEAQCSVAEVADNIHKKAEM